MVGTSSPKVRHWRRFQAVLLPQYIRAGGCQQPLPYVRAELGDVGNTLGRKHLLSERLGGARRG